MRLSDLIDRIWAAMMNPAAEDGWFLCGVTAALVALLVAVLALAVGPWTLGVLWLFGFLG